MFYDVTVYACLIAQLVISSAIIVLGAVPEKFRIALAVLGAVNGVITGLLGLLRGQGMPQRLLLYADAMRRLREDVEWMERELRVGERTVTYGEAVRLRTAYETARKEKTLNKPDAWNTAGQSGRK